jgi:DNA-binding SARP family transcriptional activator
VAPVFVVLGDIEVRAGGLSIDIGHHRQRCVLAGLVMDANHTVSADQLVDRIWGTHPPQRARGTLHVYISRLRAALLDAGQGAIVRKAGGYVLTVETDTVDVHRFRALAGEARTADDERAAALLEEALNLWQTEAFAGADTPWFTTQRDILAAERFAAQLDLADVRLRRGEHNRLLPELSARADAHPLNERAAGQMILALHRSGRTADALARFRHTHEVLAEEMGIDPGPALRHLHERVLAADRGLDLERARSQVPRQLPAAPGAFTGREDALTELTAALGVGEPSRTVVISAISGTGGIGKTWLALHWAHEHMAEFPAGQLYVNLRGFDPSGAPTPPQVAIRGFLDALAADPATIPADLDAQAAQYRSLVADKRMLIVLDNARDSTQVTPLLPGGSSCAVLVTSRHRLGGLLTGHGAYAVMLDILNPAEARRLLTRRLGIRRAEAEPRAVADLLDHCAGLPLALSIVAARAAMNPKLPLAVLAEELGRDSARLDALDAGESTADLRAVFSWSYQPLTPPAARLFRLLGIHPGPDIPVRAASSLAAGDARALLGELVHAHLVTEHAPGRFVLHDLVRDYAAELVKAEESPAGQREATHRLLDYYLQSAHAAEACVAPHRHPIALTPPHPGVTPETFADSGRAMAWFIAEYPVLLAALDRAAGTGFDTHAWQLAWALTDFLERRGHWHDQVTVHHIALTAAQRLSDAVGQVEAHRGLGRAYAQMGHPDALPHLRRALELAVDLGDTTGEAHTHVHIARIISADGRWAEALRHCQRSLGLYRAVGHRIGEARALNSVGWCHVHLGNYREALTCCGEALGIQTELDDRSNVASTLDSLAYTHYRLDDHQQAVIHYQRAIAMYVDVGNVSSQARSLDRLGDAYHAAGDIPAARQAWQQAADIHEEHGHPDAGQVRAKLSTSFSSGAY